MILIEKSEGKFLLSHNCFHEGDTIQASYFYNGHILNESHYGTTKKKFVKLSKHNFCFAK